MRPGSTRPITTGLDRDVSLTAPGGGLQQRPAPDPTVTRRAHAAAKSLSELLEMLGWERLAR